MGNPRMYPIGKQAIKEGAKNASPSTGRFVEHFGANDSSYEASTVADLFSALLGVSGVAAGYKLARGTVTPVSAAETVVTGLAVVLAAVAVPEDAVTLTHMFTQSDLGDQAGSPAAGSIIIRSQKPTTSADVTPIAATTPWGSVNWIAIGT